MIEKLRYIKNCINTGIKENYDSIISACGSEDRAYEIIQKVADEGSAKRLVLFDYCERRDTLTKEQLEKYKKWENIGIASTVIECKIDEPSIAIKEGLRKHNIQFKEVDNIAVDISCMTRPYYFLIIKYLAKDIGIKTLTIYYTEPESYKFGSGRYTEYKSSHGAMAIAEIPGFSGDIDLKKDSALIVILGFDGEMASYIVEGIGAKEIIAINGFPSYETKFKDISIVNNKEILNNIPQNNVHYSPADNPFETYNEIARIVNRLRDKNITIAPMGTKPMALGACLYALENEWIGIIYPKPMAYESEISYKSWRSWKYKV